MEYDHDECAYCYVSAYCNVLIVDDDEYHVCHPCIGRLIYMLNRGRLISMESRARFILRITKKSYGGICFLCKEDTNSGYDLPICQEHQGVFSKSDDTDQISPTIV